jgi:hypothetical protein
MEEDTDQNDVSDIVVWYCLAYGSGSNEYFMHTPNDVRNNYYIYSNKNIIYTGVGHSAVTQVMEKKLFVNTIIAAYNAQAVDPRIQFVESADYDASETGDVYYMADSYINAGENLVTDSLTFNLKIQDSNLVGSSENADNIRNLRLELFLESEEGESDTGIGDPGKKYLNITDSVEVYLAGSESPLQMVDGKIYVNSGNVYSFQLDRLGERLRTANGDIAANVTLYAKISCDYIYYGETKTAQALTNINIHQRQLFNMN